MNKICGIISAATRRPQRGNTRGLNTNIQDRLTTFFTPVFRWIVTARVRERRMERERERRGGKREKGRGGESE